MNPEQALKEALARWENVFEIARRTERDHILALMQFNATLDLQSKFQLTTSADLLGMDKKFRLAVVVREEQNYIDLMFTQTALNRLGYQMHLFRNRRKALRWLIS